MFEWRCVIDQLLSSTTIWVRIHRQIGVRGLSNFALGVTNLLVTIAVKAFKYIYLLCMLFYVLYFYLIMRHEKFNV